MGEERWHQGQARSILRSGDNPEDLCRVGQGILPFQVEPASRPMDLTMAASPACCTGRSPHRLVFRDCELPLTDQPADCADPRPLGHRLFRRSLRLLGSTQPVASDPDFLTRSTLVECALIRYPDPKPAERDL